MGHGFEKRKRKRRRREEEEEQKEEEEQEASTQLQGKRSLHQVMEREGGRKWGLAVNSARKIIEGGSDKEGVEDQRKAAHKE